MKQRLLLIALLASPALLSAQPQLKTEPAARDYKVVVAGKQYMKSKRFQKRWGSHYRKEWAEPVKVPVVYLDTLAGGLKPYQAGGGRQTMTLRLRDDKGHEYVLRSIDKRFGKALPEIYQGTFVEDIINDQVSIAHPYGAVTIPPMASAAGIYHARPTIFYVPRQPALDSFNQEFGDALYLFEQRPDENWETADNFANSKNIIGTEKLLEKLREDNDSRIDQLLYVRSRLFDMLIGDWGRHEDQWRWAEKENDGETIYIPIPRDRDQAYTLFDGKRLKFFLSVAGLDHLQSFDTTVRDITTFGFPARNLDRRAANEASLEQWLSIARDIQNKVTDQVIENAIAQLPDEVYSISGPDMIRKLKSRRNHLHEYAENYYRFLAKEVDVVGTDERELFSIRRVNDKETKICVFKLDDQGKASSKPIYSRKFFTNETNEIRLFGLGGEDRFHSEGSAGKGILIRIIPGEGKDSLFDLSSVNGNTRFTHVYDDEGSRFRSAGESRLILSDDSTLNSYRYETYEYDDRGFGIKPGLLSITLGYGVKSEKWRKDPVGSDHSIKLKYSINRAAVNIEYNGTLYQAIGKWNLAFTAGAGVPTVVNFFGIGNTSDFENYERAFFRMRSEEYYGKLGLNRVLGNHHLVELGTFYQTTRIKSDETKFVGAMAHRASAPFDLTRKHFVGGEGRYTYRNVDHAVVPSKGLFFHSSASYTHNLTIEERSFTRLATEAAVYLPVFRFLTLATRIGGATNIGESEFFHLNLLGSHDNLRGYRKQRFYGKQTLYNNNDLRLMFNVKSRIFNGKAGLIGFYDFGRVWHPGETSNAWHSGYGAGLFIAPFNKLVIAGNYGFSKEDRVLHAHIGFFF